MICSCHIVELVELVYVGFEFQEHIVGYIWVCLYVHRGKSGISCTTIVRGNVPRTSADLHYTSPVAEM